MRSPLINTLIETEYLTFYEGRPPQDDKYRWKNVACIIIVAENDTIICLDGINPLNAELNPVCHFLALLEGATIVDVSGLRVNFLFMSI